jgi:N-acetylated-alpha-linked acidic dipeptidase
MRRSAALFLALLLVLSPFQSFAQDIAPPAPGTKNPAEFRDRAWETKYRAIPEPANIKENMRRLSARPHHVGSPYDKDNAEWLLSKYKEFGWDAQIEQFDVLFPTPKERLVELLAPTTYKLKLDEPVVAVDPTSSQKNEQLPTYNAYSTDGDVTAPLVYVNYGRPADYEQLERMGVSVKGAIVIARYGASWRGIKPKTAGEHGAVGCIIYSDPRDDGYFDGDVFPKGPMRNENGVQRGSVADMPVYSGDPLTPGVGATKDAKRLALKDAKTITRVPVLPISYGDARPLLEALQGPLAPQEWRGALPITYHVGPGPAKVHMKLAFNWDIKPLYDVIAKIPGSVYPDQWVIRGNHHDGWVNGAEDPLSGQAAEMEEARALGELVKQGWKPKRTIVYASWDGEEPGLLGSTEWVETHGDELEKKAVLYINTDSNSRGYFFMEGSQILEKFINNVARDIQDPETKLSAWKRDQAHDLVKGSPEEKADARNRADLRIDSLGSGSDYTPFLQHNGVPSLDVGFGGEDRGGIYHSIYDDFYWYTHFSDSDFVYGRAIAQAVGTAVIRAADTDLVPFDFNNLADTVQSMLKDLQSLAKKNAEDVKERNQQVDDGLFAAINDPRAPEVAPKREAVPPIFNFAPLENASYGLATAAARYERAVMKANLSAHSDELKALNEQLMQAERKFISPEGLPKREWYKHLLYAPGFYTGYAVKTMPGVREAIEQKQYQDVDEQILRVAKVLQDETALLESAAQKLEGMQ